MKLLRSTGCQREGGEASSSNNNKTNNSKTIEIDCERCFGRSWKAFPSHGKIELMIHLNSLC